MLKKVLLPSAGTLCVGAIGVGASRGFGDVLVPLGWDLALIAAGCVGLIVIGVTYFLLREKPSLHVEMEIHGKRGQEAEFGFNIVNAGNVDIEIISHRYSVPDAHGYIFGEAPKHLLLKVGARVAISTMPFAGLTDANHVEFELTYRERGKPKRTLLKTERFTFSVPSSLSAKCYAPSFREDVGLGPVTADDIDVGRSLGRSEGSIFLAVFDQASGVAIHKSKTRRLILDFDNRRVLFQMISGNVQRTVAGAFKQQVGAHMVGITWKENEPLITLIVGDVYHDEPTIAHLLTRTSYGK